MGKYTYITRQYKPDMTNILKNAGSQSKGMRVGIDYAKTTHTAMICNGEGMIFGHNSGMTVKDCHALSMAWVRLPSWLCPCFDLESTSESTTAQRYFDTLRQSTMSR